MQPIVKVIPNGMHTITPHITVRDAARAVEWYKQALGAEERSRVPLPGGKLMSVELWFGDSTVMVADEFPEMGVLSPQTVGGTSTVLQLYTEDVEILWKRAVDAGAVVLHPLQDQFWGDRHGQLTDPFGHRWGLAQHLRRPVRRGRSRRGDGVRWNVALVARVGAEWTRAGLQC